MANSKPRILIAASIYPPDAGGPAVHAKAQYDWFKKNGYQVDVVALAHFRKWPRGIRHLFFLAALFKAALSLDILYAHDAWGAGFPALLVARCLRKKIIVRVGGDMPWERAAETGRTNLSMKEWYEQGLQKKNLFFHLTKFSLRRMDVIVVPSKLLSDLYCTYYHVLKEKIQVIPNPLPDLIQISAPSERTIIYASRLVGYKNLAFVLKVLQKVFAAHSDVTFLIMGDGPERKNLERLTKDLRLKDQVIFLGSVSQDEVMKKSAACLFALGPALTEFNPNYILQTLSFDKPFLVSRENGFPFSVPEDFLFDPRNESELEQKLLYLLDQTGYEKALIEAKNIDFHWSWEDCLGANQKVILELLEA